MSGVHCLRIARSRLGAAPISRSVAFRIAQLTAFLLFLLCTGAVPSCAQVPDAAAANRQADALAYCSGPVMRPIALRDDRMILCLDGRIFHEVEASLALDLAQGGYFVVRGFGGEAVPLMQLADILAAKRATVVVRDYCFAACANYLLIASAEAIVPKNALVAWTNLKSGSNDCYRFLDTADRGAPRFEAFDCASPLHEPYEDPVFGRKVKFYGTWMLVRPFKEPPESIAIRRILKRKFDETGRYPVEMLWTWNPRHYATTLRTNVRYEAYPQSQDEVDAILKQLQLQYLVIHDP